MLSYANSRRQASGQEYIRILTRARGIPSRRISINSIG